MNPGKVRDLARELETAATARVPVPPFSERYSDLTVEDAYAVQMASLEERTNRGLRLRGHKIGLTSAAMQKQLNIDSPDYGFLLENMFWSSGDPVPSTRFIQPRIEPEIAFIIGADIDDVDATREAVASCIYAVAPALEIIDSRIEDWRIQLTDTIADNASSAGVVLGQERRWAGSPDLSDVHCQMFMNGVLAGTGYGSAVMGDPVEALRWLACLLVRKGRRLRAGEIVIPGAVTASQSIGTGDSCRAVFARIGEVTCTFS